MYLRLILFMFVLSAAGCAPSGVSVRQGTDGLKPVNFQQLERRDSPNDYLVCPEGLCKKAKPDRVSPVFPMPARDLKRRVDALLSNAPRTDVVSAGATHIVAEQRSLVFGFPDTIDISVIAVGRDTSAIAVYSRSQYGYYDFGANKRRVEAWLQDLAAPLE